MPVQAWKPLLIVVPAGLLLGALGGHFARPVVQQHPDDGSLQAFFQTRAQCDGNTAQAPQEDVIYDVGGSSYPPYLDNRMLGGDREITGWQGPSFADWPQYKPAPLPSAAQLEAEHAARDAALGQRAWGASRTGAGDEAAADAAANAADEDRSGYADAQGTMAGADGATPSRADSADPPSAEPRTADGNLPAIW